MQRKILHVTASLDRSTIGATSHLSDMVIQQIKHGHDVRIVAAWRKDDDVTWAERLRSKKVTVELIGPVKGFMGTNRSIVPMVQRHLREVDIAHLHGIFSECVLQTAITAHANGIPYVWHAKSELLPKEWGQHFFRRQLLFHFRIKTHLNAAKALHFNSRQEAELAAPLHLSPPSLIESVGINPADEMVMGPVGSFRQSIKVEADACLLLVSGLIDWGSGVETLVDAVGQIKSNTQKVYLCLSGPIPDKTRTALETVAAKLGMAGRLFLLPPMVGPQKLAAFRDATLTVLPWHRELYSVEALESLSVGTPVLFTNGCALHHEALDHRFGCVSALNRNDLVREVIKVLNGSSFRQDLVNNGKVYLQEHATFEVLARRWDNLYEQLLGPVAARHAA